MRRGLALLALAACFTVGAQMKLSIEQLVSFIRSSIELKHRDRQVADYLRHVVLTERLEDAVIEDLQGQGAGPRTLEALRELRDASRNLPGRAPPKPQPAPARIPPPPAEEQKRVLENVREYALQYTRRLPDFICTQVTRRYVDPSGMEFWQRQDAVTARLTYFEQRENYQVVLVNSRPSDIPYDELGGATSSGEFGTLLKEIFEPETKTRFAWERWATLRGKRTHVFTYRVAKAQSKWRISYQRSLDIVPAYHGLIYVDRDTEMVLRVTLEAEGIPPSFPIQQAGIVLDYDYVTISDREYLLPLRFVMRMREGKLLVKNEVEFRLYRKFAADATITFETPEPLPEEQVTEKPPGP